MAQAATQQQRAITRTPPHEQIEKVLIGKMPKFLEVAPQGFGEREVKRLIRQAAIAVSRSPDLGACTPGSIALSVLQAVEMGVDLASAQPMAWIIPFKREAKLMFSYQGLIDQLYRAGTVKTVQSAAVFDADHFEIDRGNLERPFVHKPFLGMARGEIIGVYAVAQPANGGWPVFEWMPTEEVNAIRESSRSKNSPAWSQWWVQMARKCPTRRICKYLPRSPVMDRALEIDYEADGIDKAPGDDAPTRVSNSARLVAALGIESQPPAAAPAKDGPQIDSRDADAPGAAPDGPVTITEEDIPF